jgi:uncharacterized protein YndB with AHSA1/START domain/effector-binding domain-containing protein
MKQTLKVSTPTDREIVMTRVFDAPRHLVWNAMTQPELLRRWMFMPQGWAWAECEMDVCVGGKFRWAWKGPDGQRALTIWGEHREVNPPVRIVHTECMQMGPAEGGPRSNLANTEHGAAVATLELTEHGEQTHLCMTLLFPSKEARDAALASGMEHGVSAGYEQLEELLSGLKSPGTNLERIAPPVIAWTAPQLTAAIHVRVPRHKIRSAVGPALHEIMTAVKAQGIGPIGPWFDHHVSGDPEIFDFDICVPVSAPVSPTGQVVSCQIPSEHVAQAIYTGPYEGLAAAWNEFNRWVSENGHVPATDFYQCYAVGPESSPNAAEWKTELRRPLRQ